MHHVTVKPLDGSDDRFKQGTESWHRLRRTMVTGSRAGDLLYGKPGTKAYDDAMATYTTSERRAVDKFLQELFDYGSNFEDTAIAGYAEAIKHHYRVNYPDATSITVDTRLTKKDALETFFYIHEDGLIMASPDSEVEVVVNKADGTVVSEYGVLETKCPRGARYPEFRCDKAVTYADSPDLLKRGRYSKKSLPRPSLSLIKKQKKSNIRVRPPRERRVGGSDEPQEWGLQNTEFRTYYVQCVANLMLSGRDWIDFCAWTSPDKVRNKTHTFWYKENTSDPAPNIHIERMYRDDPRVMEDWEDIQERCNKWNGKNFPTLERNIKEFVAYLREELHMDPLPPSPRFWFWFWFLFTIL
jgi:hypothetical protein